MKIRQIYCVKDSGGELRPFAGIWSTEGTDGQREKYLKENLIDVIVLCELKEIIK